MITPYMEEAMACFNIINHFRQHGESKIGKSLNSVKRLVNKYENQ